jgi:hypothetical protein
MGVKETLSAVSKQPDAKRARRKGRPFLTHHTSRRFTGISRIKQAVSCTDTILHCIASGYHVYKRKIRFERAYSQGSLAWCAGRT